ncbi:polyketide synthase dehydratase domain-containing protein, partial [Aquimarina aggregata]|uniref:polyketide synthase dehydratase domain-containing protein n=1 Tax=Aquimarina aggregata TaxID=1642818 RepID=UPI0024934FB1
KAMEERLVIKAESIADVIKGLQNYINKKYDTENLFVGNAKQGKVSDFLLGGEEGNAFLNVLIQKKNLSKIATLWIHGIALNWKLLYNTIPSKISIPTYPFAKESYWMLPSNNEEKTTARLHPLVHTNDSDFNRQLYKSTFTTEDGFTCTFHWNSIDLLSTSLCIELIRTSGALALREDVIVINNIVWTKPITVGTLPIIVETELFLTDANTVDFEIQIGNENSEIAPCIEGTIQKESVSNSATIDLDAIHTECYTKSNAEDYYKALNALGIQITNNKDYLTYCHYNDDTTIIKLHLEQEEIDDQFQLEVLEITFLSLLFSALKTIEKALFIKSISRFVQYKSLEEKELYAISKRIDENALIYDVDITDAQGEILVHIEGVVLEHIDTDVIEPKEHSLATLVPNWVNESLDTTQEVS